ncbi:hypothetical protein BKA70DRAFT_1080335, partial [Coprinopsis sp. MPI-PUGE-AT-0042]
QLIANYPQAFSDFYSGTSGGLPCIYKTGPPWPYRENPPYVRGLHPARYPTEGTGSWTNILQKVVKKLDHYQIKFSTIVGVGVAN